MNVISEEQILNLYLSNFADTMTFRDDQLPKINMYNFGSTIIMGSCRTLLTTCAFVGNAHTVQCAYALTQMPIL